MHEETPGVDVVPQHLFPVGQTPPPSSTEHNFQPFASATHANNKTNVRAIVGDVLLFKARKLHAHRQLVACSMFNVCRRQKSD